MNEDIRLRDTLIEINPPEWNTAEAVLLRLHSPKRAQCRKLRPLAAVVLIILLLCGTVMALALTGVVKLYPADDIIYGRSQSLFRAGWIPERLLPVSVDLRAWMEPYLQVVPEETDPDLKAEYVTLDCSETLAPLLNNAGLYCCPLLREPIKTELVIMQGDGVKLAEVLQSFEQGGEGAWISALELEIAFCDGAETQPEIGTVIAAADPDTLERGETGTYTSPASGVTASYAYTRSTKGKQSSMDVWFPNDAALWHLSIGGGDESAQMALMQNLVDCLEK